jgi:hypothetical protein
LLFCGCSVVTSRHCIDEISKQCVFCSGVTEAERLRDLEEQQELLNSSLIALTTHFAQVRFLSNYVLLESPQIKIIQNYKFILFYEVEMYSERVLR